MFAIEAEHLVKTYNGTHNVLRDVSFSIPQGEIFGFLGPNGSGKTTMVRLLNGILSPSGGKAAIYGKSVDNHALEIHNLCGVMTETAASYESLTGLQNLLFFGEIYGLSHSDALERGKTLLHSLDLYEAKDQRVKNYSTGMKKRISLARALLHRPKVLFLDEPTSGLDPETALSVTRLIQRLACENGVTVFLCTHQLKYAEEICTLYGFLHKGTLLGFGRFEELLKHRSHTLYLEIRGEGIPPLSNASNHSQQSCRIPLKEEKEASAVLHHILKAGGQIFEARQIKWGLEDLYFYYQRSEQG